MTKRSAVCTVLGLKVWATAGMMMLILVLSSGLALANSRFTAKNDSGNTVKVVIFNGGDKVCKFSAKDTHLKSGETEGYGCEGSGKHRCKVIFKDTVLNQNSCFEMYNACDSKTINVPNGATVVIKGRYDCTIN